MLEVVSEDEMRNALICSDVIECIKRKRTPIILTKRISHADALYEKLKDKADHVFNMAGQMKTSVRKAMLEERKNAKDDESVILIATGSKAGEGFNYPRLDTLILAAPVSWEGSIEQYAGRLNRDYPGKKNVIVYDYVDSNIPMFERMYRKRMHTYSQIGFEICAGVQDDRIEKSAIYSSDDFLAELIHDIHLAKNDAVIVSPYLSTQTLRSFIMQTEEILHKGTVIHIMTIHPNSMEEDYADSQRLKVNELKSKGYTVSLIPSRKIDSSYAIIDRKIIWYASNNLLGNHDDDREVIRFSDAHAANDLLRQCFKAAGRKTPAHSVQVKMDVL
jgi:superfamily II DNA or RNA helicase